MGLRLPTYVTGLISMMHLCLTAAAVGQIPERDFEPVVMVGSAFPAFAGASILPESNELYLYAYREVEQQWQQIPFQFDERDASGDYFAPDATLSNGMAAVAGLDSNDELVFLLQDGGQRNMISWISDLDSRNFVRYEVGLMDPLTDAMVYVYLYRSTTLTLDPALTDYVAYFPSTTGNIGEDRIRTLFYEVTNGQNGLAQDWTIFATNGGSGQDLLDRLKVRATANLIISVDIDENNIVFEGSDIIQFKDGLVRVIRKMDATLRVDLPFPFSDITANFVTPPAFYYPYSTIVEIEVPQVSSASISTGRLSIDLNAQAMGMTFRSAKNQGGFPVDGQPDVVDQTLDDAMLPLGNWVSVKGTQGTLATLFPVESTTGGSRKLYYKDNSATNSDDTGDKRSYADSGISLAGGIATPFRLGYRSFYLDRDRPDDIGSQISLFAQNPLETTAVPQNFGSVPVELVAFSATVEQNDVFLSWRTVSESNNFGFDVESRRASEQEWRTLGFVPGHGTTTEPVFYQFVDHDLQPGKYEYRLEQIDTDGAFEYSPMVTATVGVPETFALHQNFPNPFNPSTTIQFQIAGDSETGRQPRAVLKIYNLLGRPVRTLVNEEKAPGFHSVAWDGTDESGLEVPSGVYFYRLQSGRFVQVRKMVFVQ
ncbi:MAG: FlgD immunoglobulin-like domain containing protein [bacterium]